MSTSSIVRLHALRSALGLPQSSVQKELRLSLMTYGKLERRVDLGRKSLERLESYFEVPVEHLLGNASEEELAELETELRSSASRLARILGVELTPEHPLLSEMSEYRITALRSELPDLDLQIRARRSAERDAPWSAAERVIELREQALRETPEQVSCENE